MNTTPHPAPGRRTRDGRLEGGEGARRERRDECILGYALLALVFVSHAAILMQHPVVGAAENGDFSRVTGPAGIVAPCVFSGLVRVADDRAEVLGLALVAYAIYRRLRALIHE